MLIDRSHRSWAIWTALLFFLATALYAEYAWHWPGGPSGRTWPGMAFGVAGTLLMAFAGLLAVRKKTVRIRFGSLSWWLKGHLWLGLLSVPLIFYHAAFRWGGTLEVLLWWTLAAVITSGMVGLALQNIVPRIMQLQLPSEAIPDQFDEVTRRLTLATDSQVSAGCGAAALEAALADAAGGQPPDLSDSKRWLANYYIREVRPYLGGPRPAASPFSNERQAEAAFEHLRKSLPDDCDATLQALGEACEERRQIAMQERLYRLLHWWLRIHVPCSAVLVLFAVIHIITALYY